MRAEKDFKRLCRRIKRRLRTIGLNLKIEFILKPKDTASHYWDGKICIAGRHAREEEIFWHEVGHAFYEQYLLGKLKGFENTFGHSVGWIRTYLRQFMWDWDISQPSGDDDRFLNEYCELCPEEDFCECFAFVMCDYDPEDYSQTIKSKLRYVEGRLDAYKN